MAEGFSPVFSYKGIERSQSVHLGEIAQYKLYENIYEKQLILDIFLDEYQRQNINMLDIEIGFNFPNFIQKIRIHSQDKEMPKISKYVESQNIFQQQIHPGQYRTSRFNIKFNEQDQDKEQGIISLRISQSYMKISKEIISKIIILIEKKVISKRLLQVSCSIEQRLQQKPLQCILCQAKLLYKNRCCYTYLDNTTNIANPCASKICTVKNRCIDCKFENGNQTVWSDVDNRCIQPSECKGSIVDSMICEFCATGQIYFHKIKGCGLPSACEEGKLVYNECLVCLEGQFLMENNQCEKVDCNEQGGYFKELISGSSYRCNKCHEDCLSCTGKLQTDCIICKQGYFINETTKLCECDKSLKDNCVQCKVSEGQFIDKNSICKDCHPSCKTCSSTLETGCLSCNNSAQFVNEDGKCKVGCDNKNGFYRFEDDTCAFCDLEKGWYLDPNKICKKCHESCLKCTDNQQISCTKCKTAVEFIYPDNTCKTGCPEIGYFKLGEKCNACNENCYKCDKKSTNCTECQNGFFRAKKQN